MFTIIDGKKDQYTYNDQWVSGETKSYNLRGSESLAFQEKYFPNAGYR